MPTRLLHAAATFSQGTRTARNRFSDIVERSLGLAYDIRNRFRRCITTAGGNWTSTTVQYDRNGVILHDVGLQLSGPAKLYDAKATELTVPRLRNQLLKFSSATDLVQQQKHTAELESCLNLDPLVPPEPTDPFDFLSSPQLDHKGNLTAATTSITASDHLINQIRNVAQTAVRAYRR